MLKQIFHSLAAIGGVVVLGILAVALTSLAQTAPAPSWTPPTASPPQGNTPTPLNVGNDGQTKIGGLWINTGGAATGLIVDAGNVGIGERTPLSKLVVAGEGDFMNNRVKGVATPIDALDAVNKAYADGLGGGGGIGVAYGQGTPTSMGSTPSCPSGWSEWYEGFGPHYRGVVLYGNSTFYSGGGGGGGGGGEEPPHQKPPEGPPPPQDGGGTITPPADAPPSSLPFRLVPTVYAQDAEQPIAIAFGSDSLCSVASTILVPMSSYSSSLAPRLTSLQSVVANACVSNICNRCRVCTK